MKTQDARPCETPDSAPKPASSPPLRVLTLVTRLDLGGAQQVVLQTLTGLAPDRYQPRLVAGRGGLLDSEALALAGVQVSLWRSFRHPIAPLCDFVTVWRLVRLMRREKIQIVHTHSSKAGLLGRIAASLAGRRPVVHTVHGWPFHEHQAGLIRWLYIRLERWAAKHTAILIAVSEATRRKGLDQGIGRPEQYQVIYPGTPLQGFHPGDQAVRQSVRAEFGFPAESPVVGMVACLKPQKAPEDFIRAAAQVREQHPEARFLLVGDGPRLGLVKSEIARLGLAGCVALAGWRRDIPRLMQAMDVLALSSLWEGLPCVFAQAMATGLPIVATDVEGAREAVVQDQTGRLVPAGQPGAMAQALKQLLDSESERRRLGAAGLNRAAQFGVEALLEQVARVYDRLGQEETKCKTG